MISNNTKKQIDYWENKTGVFVVFCKGYVDIQGEFSEDELFEIAMIQRKREKESRSVVKANQKGLFDDSNG